MKTAYLATAIAVALASFTGLPAMAADTGDDDQASTQKKDTALDEVVVTARKREETLQDVPISVTAFTEASIEKLSLRDIGDLQGHVPNLLLYSARATNNALTAYIRGIGTTDPTWGTEPSVGLYLDDVYISRAQGAMLDVFDVARIEVLRGPQGTLYGKNTTGGAVKYISKPLPTETEGFFSLNLGNYSQRDFKAAIGGASDDDKWRARVAVASLERDGFGRNRNTGAELSDKDSQAMRGSVGLFATPEFDLQLAVDALNDNSGERSSKRLIVNRFDPAHTPVIDNNYDSYGGMTGDTFTKLRGYSLVGNWYPGGAWTFKSISAYRTSDTYNIADFDGLPLSIADVDVNYWGHTFSQELQGNFSTERWSGVAGAYYFRGTSDGFLRNVFSTLYSAQSGPHQTESVALYADGTYSLTDRASLSAGLRYTHEERHATVRNLIYSDRTFTHPVAAIANFEGEISPSKVSPRISLDYDLTPGLMVYGSAARGFKAGGFNIRASTVATPDAELPFRDETVDAYEVGAKLTAFDDRLMVNTAAFYNRYRDIQLQVFVPFTQPDGTPGFFSNFTNAGRAHVGGVEVEFAYKPSEYWTINGNIATLRPRYDEYLDRGVNVAGIKRFSNAPDLQVGLNVEYTHPLPQGDLYARLGSRYQSEVYPTTDLSPNLRQGGYALVDATVIWNRDEHWSFALSGANLTDREYSTNGYDLPTLGVQLEYFGAPRQVWATATYRY